MNKTRSLILIAALALMLVIPISAQAFGIEKSSSFLVEEGQRLEKNLYILADNIDIKGEVDGDIFCVADNIFISGTINGDLICATNNIVMRGVINGDLRAVAGKLATISGKVEKNVNILAENLNLPRLSSVGRDLLAMATQANIDGSIGRDIDANFSRVAISGHIGGDVNLDVGGKNISNPLEIKDQAYIGGSINYKAPTKKITVSDEAYVNGRIKHQLKEAGEKHKKTFGFGWFYSLVTSLIIGLIIAGFFKKRVKKIIGIMTEEARGSFGWGALLFFLVPAALIIIMITIIGIPLALLLGIFWFFFLLFTKIIAGIWIGEKILKKADWQADNLLLASVIGIIIAKLLFTILILGWVLQLAAILWVTGAFWIYFKDRKKEAKPKTKKVSKRTKK